MASSTVLGMAQLRNLPLRKLIKRLQLTLTYILMYKTGW